MGAACPRGRRHARDQRPRFEPRARRCGGGSVPRVDARRPAPARGLAVPGRMELRGSGRSRSGTGPTTLPGSPTCWPASRPPLRDRRLDPRRQGRGRNARGARDARATRSIATSSDNTRVLAAEALARLAEPHLCPRRDVALPAQALERARSARGGQRGGARDRVALPARRARASVAKSRPSARAGGRASVLVFACLLLVLFVGLSYAAGWIIGREIL